MRKLCFTLFLFLSFQAFSQKTFEVRGMVADTSGQSLASVTVKIIAGRDSMMTATDATGAFRFLKIASDSFTVIATYSGHQSFVQTYLKTSQRDIFQVPAITLIPASGMMEGIVIQSVRPIIVKEDTIQYNAAAYPVREGAPVEDVIKKLPGVTVDKDGNIEAQGKKVARVRVNGKDFFGGDVQTATQNLPADIIDNIQIIDDYGDQANVTGIKNGEPEKIINITVQKNKNRGSFGNATAAAGTQDRYAGNIFVNNFHDERQISFLGSINNTNANLFNFNGGGRGGGGRGANLGSGDRGGWGGSGITLTRSAGFNYRDKWGKKISVYGSYSYSSRNSNVLNSSFAQDLNLARTTQRESNSHSTGQNHRLTFNMEYAIDSFNYLKATPYFSYGQSANESMSRSIIQQSKLSTQSSNSNRSSSESPNGGGNVLYNHRFAKRGRNFSANFTVDFSKNNNDRFSNSTYHDIDSTNIVLYTRDTTQIQNIDSRTKNTRTNAHLSYTEPLNAAGTTVLEANYDWNNSATESLREVYDLADSTGAVSKYNTLQSNHYNYTFLTHRIGFSVKGRKEKYNYSVGFQSQPSNLSGESIDKSSKTNYSNINWVPSARFVYNFARNNSLTATIDGTAREPNFQQLQPVVDSSNLSNIVIGNPGLKNEFTNTFAIRYNKFDNKAGSSLFINLSYDETSDKIVTSRMAASNSTRRSTTYVNTNGFNGLNGNASFTQPFKNRKYTVGVNMAASYDNNISFTNGQKNKGTNWNFRPGANVRMDIKDKIDLSLRADYTLYQASTRYATYTNSSKAQTLNIGINGKNYFKDLTLCYDFSRVINYGFSKSVSSNPTILNAYVEYRFLKKKMLTARFQGFDLFNKNTGITRTINENVITDNRSNRLSRYFLVSLNVRLAKFTGSANMNRRNGNGGGGGRNGGQGRNRS